MNCLNCDKPLTKPYQKKYCSNTCKLSPNFYANRKVKEVINQPDQVAICKVDGWIGKDYNNVSGNLTKHLRAIGVCDDDVMSHYDIVKITPKQRAECPACLTTTSDTTNKSGWWTKHITNHHNTTVEQFLAEYPDLKHLFFHQSRLIDHKVKLEDGYYTTECKVCNQKMEKITETHAKLHNMTVAQYKSSFPDAAIVSPYLAQQISINTSSNNLTRTFNRRSQAEKEIEQHLIDAGFSVVACDRSLGIEVDLLIPSHKLAIEYNGLLYHSETYGSKGRSYHLQKTKVLEQSGYQLLHIFEDEWCNNKQLVLNKVLAKLGGLGSRVYARKCSITTLSKQDARQFLEKHHIQGKCKSPVYLGLHHHDKLVAVMSFSPLRKALGATSKSGVYELVRYATSCQVVGGAGKLLKHFERSFDPNTVISYADRRYSHPTRNLYLGCGFSYSGSTNPSYWYMKNYKKRLHRYNFTKGRLVSKYGADPTKSEWEIMQSIGYDRVWDCGTLKFIKHLTQTDQQKIGQD